jgi:hypothetical protein
MPKITASPTTITSRMPRLRQTRRKNFRTRKEKQGKPKRSPLHRIAVHEAGHVVAAMCLNIYVHEATIVRRGKIGGQTLIGFPACHPGDTADEAVAKKLAGIVTYCAGWSAETVIYGDCDFGTCTDDFGNANRLLEEVLSENPSAGEDDRMELIHASKERAIDLMREHSAFVQKVSRQLLRRKTLHEDDLLKMYMEYTSGHRVSKKFIHYAREILRDTCAIIEEMGDLSAIAVGAPPAPGR